MSFLYWFRVSRFVRSQVSYLLSIGDAQGCFNPDRAIVSLFIDSRGRENCLCITTVVGITLSPPEVIGWTKENVSLLIESSQECVVERSRFVSGRKKNSKFMVIGRFTSFPVTWSGIRERWSEMSSMRRAVAMSAMAVVALVVVF